MTIPEFILTFRVTVPAERDVALNLRDKVLDGLLLLGIRPALIEPPTIVRLTVDQGTLAALTAEMAARATVPSCGDDGVVMT